MNSNNVSMLAGGEEEYELNRSYNSVLSGTSSVNASTSSKAVLAALRALQDKIRRLEAERTQALDETSQLKHQLQTQGIEAEHSRQKEHLAVQKSLQEARSGYDRLLTEKNDLENRAVQLEEKNKIALTRADEMQSKIRFLEDEKHSTALRMKDLEHKQQQMEAQLRNTEHKEKDMAQSIIWETKRHEEEVTTLRRRVESLQDELSVVSSKKGVTDAKIAELDQLVGQLLSVNEQLVNQLSGKAIKGDVSPTKMAKKVKKVNKASSSAAATARAASQTTASFEANKTTKYSTRKPSQLIAVKSEELEQLKSMHKMYASLAHNLHKGSGAEATSASGKKTKKKKASSTAASKTEDPGTAPRQSRTHSASPQVTRLSRKKAILQEKYETDAANHSMRSASPKSFSLSRSNRNMDVHLPKPVSSADTERDESDLLDLDGSGIAGMAFRQDGELHDRYYHHHQMPPALSSSPPRHSGVASTATASTGTSHDTARLDSMPAYTDKSESTENRGELKSVIAALEDEFDQLNVQYRQLLSNVSASADANTGANANATTEGKESGSDADYIQTQAEEIVSVIQKLHKKGEQLRTLRNSPLNSPQR